jgi:hypothetical protein
MIWIPSLIGLHGQSVHSSFQQWSSWQAFSKNDQNWDHHFSYCYYSLSATSASAPSIMVIDMTRAPAVVRLDTARVLVELFRQLTGRGRLATLQYLFDTTGNASVAIGLDEEQNTLVLIILLL